RIFSLIRRTMSCRCLTAAWKTSGRGDRATSGLDLLLRGLGERVNGEFELHPADVSVAKHLHKFTLVDDATGDELVLADLATLREHAGQIAHVHRLVLGTEAVVETTQLRKPHVDGICPPSKPTGTFFRALVPFVPRPAVLPPLEASPRPTRIFSRLAPGAGFRWWILMAIT